MDLDILTKPINNLNPALFKPASTPAIKSPTPTVSAPSLSIAQAPILPSLKPETASQLTAPVTVQKPTTSPTLNLPSYLQPLVAPLPKAVTSSVSLAQNVKPQDYTDVLNVLPQMLGTVLSPAVSAGESVVQAVTGKEMPNIKIPGFGGRGNMLDTQTSQSYYSDLLDKGESPSSAFWKTALKTVGDVSVLVPMAQDFGKFVAMSTNPTSLIESGITKETAGATKEQIADYLSGRVSPQDSPIPDPLRKALSETLANGTREEKIKILQGMAPQQTLEASPSRLGRLLGVSQEEASQILEDAYGTTRETSAGALPGYKPEFEGQPVGASVQRQVRVGGEQSPTPPAFEGFKDITTNVLDKLEGRGVVSKQFISDLTNAPELKQAERDIIRNVLKDYPDGANIPVKEFADKVHGELLPLERGHTSGDTGTRYEHVSLPDELKGPVANYSEQIYQSPIKTSAGDTHYSQARADNYFAHSRIEDLPPSAVTDAVSKGSSLNDAYDNFGGEEGTTRRVIELQSDLFQKGRLENEADTTRLEGKTYDKAIDEGRAPTATRESIEAGQARKAEIAKLEPYRNTWHERVIREEVKQAAVDGKTKLQFPTGETAMKIEGLGGEYDTWYNLRPDTGTGLPLKESDIVPGKEIKGNLPGYWVITENLGEGKFKAIPKHFVTEARKTGEPNESLEALLNYVETAHGSSIEQFDISKKLDTDNPIHKFYEKEVGRYLKNKYDAKLVTDPQGVKWWEVNVKPEMAGKPVQAFKRQSAFDPAHATESEVRDLIHRVSGIPKNEVRIVFDSNLTDENGEAIQGRYTPGARGILKPMIELYSNGGQVRVGTAFHEAWHYVEDNFLSAAEKAEALEIAKKEMGPLSKTAYKGYTDQEKYQEFLADKYADYSKDRAKYKTSPLRKIFLKIDAILKRIVDAVGKVKEYFKNIPNKEGGFVNLGGSEENVPDLEKNIVDIYKGVGQHPDMPGFHKADEVLANIDHQLETSRPGERVFTGYGSDAKVEGISSTFPQWIPERLRSSELFSKVMKGLDLNNLKYPEGPRPKQRELYNILLDEADRQLGVDTSKIRAKIIESYGKKNQSQNNKENQKGNGGSSARGKESGKEEKILNKDGRKSVDVEQLQNMLSRVEQSLRAFEENPEAHIKAYGENRSGKYKDKINELRDRIRQAVSKSTTADGIPNRQGQSQNQSRTMRAGTGSGSSTQNGLDSSSSNIDEGQRSVNKKAARSAEKQAEYDARKVNYDPLITEANGDVLPPQGRGGLEAPEVNWKGMKDVNLLWNQRETLDRVFDKITDPKTAQVMKEFLFDPVKENETRKVRAANTLRTEIAAKLKDLGIGLSDKDVELIMHYGEGRMGEEELAKLTNRPKVIKEASDYFRSVYDKIIDKWNVELRSFNMKEVPKRANYFRHFDDINFFTKEFGFLSPKNTQNLPTSLAGETEFYKPGKPFSTASLRRTGNQTAYNPIKGMDNYIDATFRQIFHTDSVQRARLLEKYLKETSKALEGRGPEEALNLQNFRMILQEYTNAQLAGKLGTIDRAVEKTFGRPIVKVLQGLGRYVGKNIIAGNLSAALSHLVSLPLNFATVSKTGLAKGFLSTLAAPLKAEPYNTVGGVESSFMVRRYPQQSILPSKIERAEDALNVFMSVADRLKVRLAVSSKYYEGIEKGLDPKDAMKAADKYAAHVVGDATTGSKPNIMNNRSAALFAQFQLALNDGVSVLTHDIPHDAPNKTKLISAYIQYVIAAYLLNKYVYKKLRGAGKGIDPVGLGVTLLGLNEAEKNKPFGKRLADAGTELAGELPFTNLFTGDFPIRDAFPHLYDLLTGKTTLTAEGLRLFGELGSPIGGATQAVKSFRGVEAVVRGHTVTTTGKTKTRVNRDLINYVKAAVFGPTSLAAPKPKGSISGLSGIKLIPKSTTGIKLQTIQPNLSGIKLVKKNMGINLIKK